MQSSIFTNNPRNWIKFDVLNAEMNPEEQWNESIFGFLNSAIYFSSLYCTVRCIELGSIKLKQRLFTKTKSVERHDSET